MNKEHVNKLWAALLLCFGLACQIQSQIALAADDPAEKPADDADSKVKAPPLVRPLKSRSERARANQDDLANSIKNKTSGLTGEGSTAIWLKAADVEFLGVHTPAASAKTFGTVLILHAEGEHPLWPGSILNLQNYLPGKGWATLAIALPDQVRPDPPPLPTKEELAKHTTTIAKKSGENTEAEKKDSDAEKPIASENEDKEIFDDTENKISDGSFIPEEKKSPSDTKDPSEIESQTQDRIIAAIDHIKQNGSDAIVLYGQGLGGFRAGHYLQESGNTGASIPNSLKGLIIVDAVNEMPSTPKPEESEKNNATAKKITDSFTNPDFPISDIITNSTPSNIRKSKKRRNEAKRQGLKKYRQLPIANSNGDTFLGRIYGFLKTNCQ
ncbi:MAG: alpha/beta hydrolase family protein [Cellvibrionaceae bacterium]